MFANNSDANFTETCAGEIALKKTLERIEHDSPDCQIDYADGFYVVFSDGSSISFIVDTDDPGTV